ncbi:hypothetical protein HMPREF0021_00485 [Acinetobacter baumannii 6013150]|nr:hypothetical protein HMPREF0021_00485 [Acinetobacter baumannii 6013150]
MQRLQNQPLQPPNTAITKAIPKIQTAKFTISKFLKLNFMA